jgi:hypothetical protein
MLLKDMAKIYIAGKRSEIIQGIAVTSYIDLRHAMANIQYMSNEEERKIYGVISNSVIIVRAPNPVKCVIGDGIYLSEPDLSNGSYGEPDYNIESVKTAYIGVTSVRNPIIITARKNNDKSGNQT